MGLFWGKKAENKKILRFVSAGSDFFSALFCGSSRVGAVVLGGAKRENIRLNDSRVFKDGFCGVAPNEDIFSEENDKLDGKRTREQISKLLKAQDYNGAENYLTDELSFVGYTCQKMETMGVVDVFIDHQDLGLVNDYHRSLNMETGEIRIDYAVSDGRIERRVFVDRETDVTCIRIDSTRDRFLQVEIGLQDVNREKKGKIALEKDLIIYENEQNGVKFGAVGRLETSGEVDKTTDSFVVSNTKCIYFFVKTFVEDESGNFLNATVDVLNKIDFEEAFVRTSSFMKEKMNLTTIDFFDSCKTPIENQLIETKQGKVTGSLVEKMYNYGKYLFLCGFDGKFSGGLFYQNGLNLLINNHIVLSRMLSFTFQNGLFGAVKPILMRFCEKKSQYNNLAKKLFGCDGIFVPANEDLFSGAPSDITVCNLLDKNIGSEISLILSNYVKQSGDIEFLKDQGYDFIRGVGEFYLSFFDMNMTSHSFDSPFGVSSNSKCENTGRCIASNCVSDFMGAKVVFYILLKLCVMAGHEEDMERWEDALSKIPDVEVDNHGIIKEYNSNLFLGSNRSPYISYLFPYNVGFKPIATKKDYETLVANTIKYKYLSALGYMGSAELIDLALALFTCGEGRDGGAILNSILMGFLSSNLIIEEYDKGCLGFGDGVTKFGNLTIDKNLCLCKCLQNMFAICSNNNIFLFDSLPEYSKRMRVIGLRLSYGLTINIDVNLKKKVAKVRIKSTNQDSVNIFLPKSVRRVKGKDLPEIDFVQNVLSGVILPKNKYKKIKVFF